MASTAYRQAAAFISNRKRYYIEQGITPEEAHSQARKDLMPLVGVSRQRGAASEGYPTTIVEARRELKAIHNGGLDHQTEFDVCIIASRKLAQKSEAAGDYETAAKILRDCALLLKDVAIYRLEHPAAE